MKKLKNIFGGKSVHITEEGYEYLHKQNEDLIVPFNIIKIRPSRKFKIQMRNITQTGVILKDIIIPFKYLKVIKHNGKNKK
jgi:hypothetical protein